MANRMRLRPKLLLSLLIIAVFPIIAACSSTDAPMTTFDPQSDVAREIQGTYIFIFWLAVVVFIIVEGALVYAVFRYRRRSGDGIPRQVEGNMALEVTWTIIPALVLVAIAVPTWITIFRTADIPANAYIINITGHQWWWEVEYPELGVTTANEIHVPVNRTIGFNVETEDVLHSFWVPQLFGKIDVVPGRTNTVWFTPDANTEGRTFLGQCVEFCGISHANMRMQLVVDSPSEFAAWGEGLSAPAPALTGAASVGHDLFASKGCTACHSINNRDDAVGLIGPNLTNFGGRATLAAAIKPNTPENLQAWLEDPNAVKPGNLMAADAPVYNTPQLELSSGDIQALVAYLHALQ